jgi:hypothetical protein
MLAVSFKYHSFGFDVFSDEQNAFDIDPIEDIWNIKYLHPSDSFNLHFTFL